MSDHSTPDDAAKLSAPETGAVADMRSAGARIYSEELFSVFNISTEPLWICDSAGAVLLANAAALALPAKASGLQHQDGALFGQLRHGGRTIPLKDAILLASAHPNGLSCPIARAAERAFLHIVQLKWHSSTTSTDRYLLYFMQSSAPDLECARLQMMLGLTEAEAKLVRLLVLDHSVREVAKQIGVTPNTVRSQLKSIFRKTEVRRQTELVRLVLTLTRAISIRPRHAPLETQPAG